jgi:hypothetical protein
MKAIKENNPCYSLPFTGNIISINSSMLSASLDDVSTVEGGGEPFEILVTIEGNCGEQIPHLKYIYKSL